MAMAVGESWSATGEVARVRDMTGGGWWVVLRGVEVGEASRIAHGGKAGPRRIRKKRSRECLRGRWRGEDDESRK